MKTQRQYVVAIAVLSIFILLSLGMVLTGAALVFNDSSAIQNVLCAVAGEACEGEFGLGFGFGLGLGLGLGFGFGFGLGLELEEGC